MAPTTVVAPRSTPTAVASDATPTTLPPAPENLAGNLHVSFFNAQHGWLLSGRDIYRTEDGGATWSGPAPTPGGNFFEFVDIFHGWIVEATWGYPMRVHRTEDGGRTWSTAAGGEGDVTDVDFADGLHGWAVGNDGFAQATTDGGKTWLTQDVGGRSLAAVAAVDGDHAWAASLSGGALRTDDGGETWVPVTVPALQAGAMPLSMSAVDRNHVWIGTAGGQVAATADGGSTWTTQTIRGQVRDIDFASPQVGYALGAVAGSPDTAIVGTTDGGRTWTVQHQSPQAFADVEAGSATQAWACGVVLLRTTDGQHWGR
jgi:photosystem II stability/assembly factor-like uncharacterized protein